MGIGGDQHGESDLYEFSVGGDQCHVDRGVGDLERAVLRHGAGERHGGGHS